MDSKTYWIGMLDWKVNQKIFEAIGTKTDILGVHIPASQIKPVQGNLVDAIEQQFFDLENIFVPAKSYCVALVYAGELAKDYGGSMLDYLRDPELLTNDIYYCPYDKDPLVYDYFLSKTNWQYSPMAERVKDYYRKEIHLEGLTT